MGLQGQGRRLKEGARRYIKMDTSIRPRLRWKVRPGCWCWRTRVIFRLKTVVFELLFDILASFFGTQALDAETARNHCKLHQRLKHADSVAFELQQVSLRSLGWLIRYLADVLVAPKRVRHYWFHQVCEDYLEGML